MTSRTKLEEFEAFRQSYSLLIPSAPPTSPTRQRINTVNPLNRVWLQQKEATELSLKELQAQVMEAKDMLGASEYRLPIIEFGKGEEDKDPLSLLERRILPNLSRCRTLVDGLQATDQLQTAVKTRLATRLANLAATYKQVQTMHLNRLEQRHTEFIPSTKRRNNTLDYDEEKNIGFAAPVIAGNEHQRASTEWVQSPMVTEQTMMLKEEMVGKSAEIDRDMAEDRLGSYQRIERESRQVTDIMTHMQSLMSSQGEKIQLIHETVEDTSVRIMKSKLEVEKRARRMEIRQKWRMFGCLVVVGILLVVVLIFK